MNATPLRVLVISRNYPNEIMPELGLWVEGLVRHTQRWCESRVIAPVPYCPPLPPFVDLARFRRIGARGHVNGVEVWRPRFLTGPGYSLHSLEAGALYWRLCRGLGRLRRQFPFDLIHACFTYPEGVVAARLARRCGVPVIISEHASWRPWMDDYPLVRRQALQAARECRFHIVPSRYARNTIAHFTGDSSKLRVIPNGVDGSTFTILDGGRRPGPDQILFVGFVNRTKGVDVLLRAMRVLLDRRPRSRLVLVGGGFYRDTRRQGDQLQRLAVELGVQSQVQFVGMKTPVEVAACMRESALLVLPSRRETFGSVLVEALACGTPVVATRCGGPEDIVNEKVGQLAPPEDAPALAGAMEHVLAHRDEYDPTELRTYALERFSWELVARRTMDLYMEAVAAPVDHLRGSPS
jgi:glycosyltransferase involved in cell wall biosynthesis